MNIFSTARIRFNELYQDSIDFIQSTYGNVGDYFSMASPMGQLLQVVLNLGRVIIYYIEDAVTELNINTATRSDNIKGLIALTGHNPSRAMAARGVLRLKYNGNPLSIAGNTIIIPNFAMLNNLSNGLTYVVTLPSEEARLDITQVNSYIDVSVVQGSIEYQQATGDGENLQSFNFQSKKGASVDNFFVNIYVDGER